jgi:hypothetical protein
MTHPNTPEMPTPRTTALMIRLFNSKLNMAEIVELVEAHAEQLERELASRPAPVVAVPTGEEFAAWAKDAGFPVETWNVSDHGTFYSFFLHGFRARSVLTPPPAMNEEAVEACAREICDTFSPPSVDSEMYIERDGPWLSAIIRSHLAAGRKEGV